jgi:hypothetical protein
MKFGSDKSLSEECFFLTPYAPIGFDFHMQFLPASDSLLMSIEINLFNIERRAGVTLQIHSNFYA